MRAQQIPGSADHGGRGTGGRPGARGDQDQIERDRDEKSFQETFEPVRHAVLAFVPQSADDRVRDAQERIREAQDRSREARGSDSRNG